ncbi:probable hydrolase [unidentified eubacterium SCB49]|nr:probable hydrolase [unidentified eubacterium SCB49]
MNNLFLKAVGALINFTAIFLPKWNANNSFKILSKVKRAGISESGMVFLNKAEQTHFECEGQSSVLYKWGNGPKNVLFLHGWMSNSQRWLPYYEKLDKTKYTMYALDAPGHGKSKTDYLNLEMYRQAINVALSKIGAIDTVICHSFSNTALTYTYLENPEIDIKKFIVMGSPTGMGAIFVFFKEKLGLSKKSLQILSKKVNQILHKPYQDILVKNLLKQAPQQKLVIHDKGDRITPFAPIKEAIENTLGLETLITTGLKHDLKSEEVYNKVINFIERPTNTL